jgi:glycosyltransferase involved in cell wall biosynthesis
MASGVPAVVTDVGGNREVVVEGETGYLVPVDDDGLLAGRVCELLQGIDRGSWGRAAGKRVNEDFSVTGMMGEYQKLY